ncbi:hypothetical protein [Massilia sp. BHUDP2]|uniref:hypothetical protein n=1 Tax=Massilia sp. BHUDP2 TaxID=3034505 RepID=UPI003905D13F
MGMQVMPYPFRIDQAIRERAEKLAKMDERSLNWMLNKLLGPAVEAELARREKEREAHA